MYEVERKKIFKFVVATAFLGVFAALFMPFYTEILLAAVFAWAMEPGLSKYLQPKRMGWRTAVALFLVTLFTMIAAPMTVVFYKTYSAVMAASQTGFQNTELYHHIVQLKAQVTEYVNALATKAGVENRVDFSGFSEDYLSRLANWGMAVVSQTFYQIPSLAMSLFVFGAALYFFLAESRQLRIIFERQKVVEKHTSSRLIEILQNASYTTVVSSLIIGVMQASLVAIGGLIFKAGDFAVVFVVTFFVSFIPVIGAAPVALALALYKVLVGEYGMAIGLVVVALIAGTSDNLVRPYILSSSEGDLHPIVSLFAIIGALILFGMPGLFLGPVIASVAVKIIPTLYSGPTVSATDLEEKGI